MSPLRIGLVGAGHISRTHLAAWKLAPGCSVVAIHDRDRDAAAARAAAFGVGVVAEDLEQLIAACDVVDVCTPPQSHAAIAQQVTAAGRHLLIEKPVVTDPADWERLRSTVEQHQVSLCVVHNIKFERGVQRALRWVAAGRIGRILRLHREFLTHPESDRMLVAERHWSHDLPGGRWFETLPHALYLTHAFVGPLELDHVAAFSTAEAPSGAPIDEVAITLRGNGCIATIDYSAHCRVNRRRLTLEGTDGAIEVDILGDSAVLHRGRDAKWKRPWTAGLRDACDVLAQWVPDRLGYLADRLQGRSPHSRLIHGFAHHLLGGGPHPTPLDEVDYVVRMSDGVGRAIDAARHG
jgi:predicted dehydrogenase